MALLTALTIAVAGTGMLVAARHDRPGGTLLLVGNLLVVVLAVAYPQGPDDPADHR